MSLCIMHCQGRGGIVCTMEQVKKDNVGQWRKHTLILIMVLIELIAFQK